MATTARGYPYPVAGDPANVPSDIQALAAAVDADVTAVVAAETAADAAAVAYTSAAPTWAAGAGSPSVGNGSLTGKHQTIGKTVHFQFNLTAGSTTTFGTAGTYFTWTIPGGGTADGFHCGTGWFTDISAGNNYPLSWLIVDGGTVLRTVLAAGSTAASELLNNSPVTIASGDSISLCGSIKVL